MWRLATRGLGNDRKAFLNIESMAYCMSSTCLTSRRHTRTTFEAARRKILSGRSFLTIGMWCSTTIGFQNHRRAFPNYAWIAYCMSSACLTSTRHTRTPFEAAARKIVSRRIFLTIGMWCSTTRGPGNDRRAFPNNDLIAHGWPSACLRSKRHTRTTFEAAVRKIVSGRSFLTIGMWCSRITN